MQFTDHECIGIESGQPINRMSTNYSVALSGKSWQNCKRFLVCRPLAPNGAPHAHMPSGIKSRRLHGLRAKQNPARVAACAGFLKGADTLPGARLRDSLLKEDCRVGTKASFSGNVNPPRILPSVVVRLVRG